MRVYFSNKIELLYERLKDNLYSPNSNPFTKRLIMNPSPSMKSWIFTRLASDLGIASGIEMLSPDGIINFLNQQFLSKSKRRLPNHLELTMSIENEIRRCIQLKEQESQDFKGLHRYLSGGSESRCAALAERLSSLFYQYGKYAGAMVRDWEVSNHGGWQGWLWRKLFLGRWTYLYRELDREFDQDWSGDAQLHVFAMSYLSPLEHRFLTRASQCIPVNYYILTPCSTFWSDLLTDRELEQILLRGKQRGFTEAQQQELEKYYVVGNRLLANSGKLGRSMAWQIEESGIEMYSDYLMPEAIRNHSAYAESLGSDLNFENPNQPLTLLQSVQADMALLRDPDQTEKIQFDTNDSTIQLHAASSPLREVQILHDTLLQVIERHLNDEEPICPSDILVMAPDITAYAPYIKRVFAEEDNKFDYLMMDLHPMMQNPLVQGFLQLLKLPFGRWDAISLIELFEHPAFSRKHRLKFEDIHLIKQWIKETQVRWGDDAAHRSEILEREYGTKSGQEGLGTWAEAQERLLLGLVMSSDSDDKPISIDMSSSELLGDWIRLMRSLRKDLGPLTSGIYLSAREWSDHLLKLYDDYFQADSELEQQLLEQLKAFRFEHELADEKFPFTSILAYLEKSLTRCNVSYRENHLNAVRFCTLLPMRAIPAKVIVLMGMHEGAFPKILSRDSLNLMLGHEGVDYCPTQNDYDRFLFLETLLSARNYYIVTYQGVQHPDGKEQSPSLLVSELLSYLDRSCSIDGKKPSECILVHHPFTAWDQEYFKSDTTMRSYSTSAYKAALACYNYEKSPSLSFVGNFQIASETKKYHDLTIDLKQLNSSARSPVQSYFNSTLKMYLERDKDREVKDEEDFSLSDIDRAQIRKQALKLSWDEVKNMAERSGKLPPAPFRFLAIEKIQEEVETIKVNLESIGITEKSFFNIDFHEAYSQALKNESGDWTLPPLQINEVKIIGKLVNVCSKGLVVDVKDDKQDIIKIWPQYLILNCLIDKYALPIEKNLIFSKKGTVKQPFFEDAIPLLDQYIECYLLSLENISPLIPEWVPDLMQGDVERWQKKVQNQVSSRYSVFFQDYLLWTTRGRENIDLESISKHWKPHAETLYGELYKNWYD